MATGKSMVTVIGAKELEAKLRALAEKAKHPERMFMEIVVEVDGWVQRNIKREGSMIQAGGWPPFKSFTYKGVLYTRGRIKKGRATGKDYPKWKWTVDPRARLLQDTGKLRGSIRHYYSKTGGKVFTRLPYAIAHDQGEGHLPARQLIPLKTHRDIQRIALGAARRYIRRAAAEANQ